VRAIRDQVIRILLPRHHCPHLRILIFNQVSGHVNHDATVISDSAALDIRACSVETGKVNMNSQKVFALIFVGALLVTGCSRKSASNSNPNNSSSNQTAASQPAPAPPTESQPAPQAASPPPPSEPAQQVSPSPAEKIPAPVKPAPAPYQAVAPQQSAVPPPPKPAPKPIVIPAGTVLSVRLDQPISSKTNQTGDPFHASVSSPIVIQGKTIVPTGARASGTVTDAKDAGRFKGAATLTLALNTVVIGGKQYKVQTAPATKTSKGKGSRTAKMVGGGTVGGALIGGIAGGGKGAAIGALVGAGAGTAGSATGNADINLPVETVMQFQMTAPVVLPPRPEAVTTAPEDTTAVAPPD
jgi:hypothetical protein